MEIGYGGIRLDNLEDKYELPMMLPEQEETEEKEYDQGIRDQMIELLAQGTDGIKAEVAYVAKS